MAAEHISAQAFNGGGWTPGCNLEPQKMRQLPSGDPGIAVGDVRADALVL